MKPATRTPAPKSGRICFIKPQVDSTQLTHSSLVNQVLSMIPKMISNPTAIYHLAAKMAGQIPVEPAAGLAKAAKIKIRTMVSM